jgi:pimeloyl-ACP methyl ester carboxylesterase
MPIEKSVSIGEGEDALFGTLMLPDGKNRFDAVLIWSGSGPTDRDGNLPGQKNNCLKMVAHQLADAGYASIRTDKRGIGESENAVADETELRFEAFVDDALVWAQILKEVRGVRHVFLLGHSEGALTTMLVARDFDAAGMILIEGTGFRASDVLRRQLSAPDINIPKYLVSEISEILDSLDGGTLVAEFSAELEGQYRESIQPYLISWFKYDPQEELAKTKLPVMVIQGTTDFQVLIEEGERLAAARGDIKYLQINGMNQVLKDAPKHRASNYATYGKPLLKLAVPLMPTIIEFLDEQARSASVANDR